MTQISSNDPLTVAKANTDDLIEHVSDLWEQGINDVPRFVGEFEPPLVALVSRLRAYTEITKAWGGSTEKTPMATSTGSAGNNN